MKRAVFAVAAVLAVQAPAVFAAWPVSSKTKIEDPAVNAGLVFDNTEQVGVAAGEHYTLSGTTSAVAAGEYQAKATPKSGYCWSDRSTKAKTVKWSIARRPAAVRAVDAQKRVGEDDPVFETVTEGLVGTDETVLTWDILRTNECEEVGSYDLLVVGAARQGNYDITFDAKGATLTILPEEKPVVSPADQTEILIGFAPGVGRLEGRRNGVGCVPRKTW